MWHQDGEIFYFQIPNSASQIGMRELSLKRRPGGWAATLKGDIFEGDNGMLANFTTLIIADVSIEEAKHAAIVGVVKLIEDALAELHRVAASRLGRVII